MSSIVTDDNPRSEVPAEIRAAIMAAAPGAIEIGDRREAIHQAVAMLQPGDTLIVAGKGHEEGQTIGAETFPFSDHDEVRKALKERARMSLSVDTEDLIAAMGGRPFGRCRKASPAFPSTAARLQPGEAFFAIKGDPLDGHDFATAAIEAAQRCSSFAKASCRRSAG